MSPASPTRAEHTQRGLQQRSALRVAIAGLLHGVAVDAKRHVVEEDAAVHLADVDPPLDPGGERVEGPDDVVPVQAEVEGEVVARPCGHADEGKPVLERHRSDDRERAVAAGDAERAGSTLDRRAGKLGEVVARAEHDRVDSALARSFRQGGASGLAAAGFRVDEEHSRSGGAHSDLRRRRVRRGCSAGGS